MSEIWRTEQTFRAFYDYRLVPALRMHGVDVEPEVEVAPLHNLFAVEMDTVERMGAVSLPATYAGAALYGAPHRAAAHRLVVVEVDDVVADRVVPLHADPDDA